MRTVFALLLALVCGAHSAAQEPPAAPDRHRPVFGDGEAVLQRERRSPIDVTHYAVRVEFDLEAKCITGAAELQFTALADLETVHLHFGNLAVESVRRVGGAPLVHRYDAVTQLLEIELAAPMAKGANAGLRIVYAGHPKAGLHFIGPDEGYPAKPLQCWSQGQPELNRYWFPCWDKPNDFATFATTFVVPNGFTAVGNGRLVKTAPVGESQTAWTWAQEQPHATYLTSVVVAQMERSVAKAGELQLDYYIPAGWPGAAEVTQRAFGQTGAMIAFMQRYFGVPYPSPKYAQSCVVDYLSGGMENTSATTLTTLILLDERAALDWSSQDLVSHELAHQWFGDLVTCRDWPHIWLNEAFATYAEALWVREHEGADAFRNKLSADLGWYWNEDATEYRRPIVTDRYAAAGELFDGHTYSKGGRILAMLHELIGDEAFRAGCKRFLEAFRHRPVTTADFRQVIEGACGKPLDWFFDQWLYQPGHPELEVTVQHDPDTRLLRCTVTQVQDRTRGTPLYRLPLSVVIAHGEQRTRQSFELSTESNTFTWRCETAPEFVRFEPTGTLLAEVTYDQPTEALIAQLAHDSTDMGRIDAAYGLAMSLTSSPAHAALAREALASASKDRALEVRAAACWALGSLGARSVPHLLVALTDPASRVRRAAVDGLAQAAFGDGAAVEATVGRLVTTDPSYLVRAAALRALGHVNADSASALALAALQQDSHREVVRVAALETLFESGHGGALKLALGATAYGRPPSLRVGAIGVLERQAGTDPATTERFIELCSDRSTHVKAAVGRALVALRPPAAAAALTAMRAREADYELRAIARRALFRIAQKRPTDVPAGK